MPKKKFSLYRVDAQVSLLVAGVMLFSSLCVFSLCYALTYRDMIHSLSERVNTIYHYVEDQLAQTFTRIDETTDASDPHYLEYQQQFNDLRSATGVRYLYTARLSADGRLVYLIDGLPLGSYDFRFPGDVIEPEVAGEMERALSGEHVLPSDIKNTDWGKIFIAYLPVYGDDGIVGVVGIEFDAEHQYDTYRLLSIATPVIILLFCAAAICIAVFVFRRISNPSFHDMANTDQLTGVKNRNAFETDMGNLRAAQKRQSCAVVMDLNGLKRINDTQGHTAGDRYIQLASQALIAECGTSCTAYRTGGDEFYIFLPYADGEQAAALIGRICARFSEMLAADGLEGSLAAGYAAYEEPLDEGNILRTFSRADAAMYAHKREMRGDARP